MPGATRAGPASTSRPELPEALLQRMQAVVNAAHARAVQEEEARREQEGEPDQAARPEAPASLPRRVPGAAGEPNGVPWPKLPAAPNGRLSDAESDTDPFLPRLTASGAIASPPASKPSAQPDHTAQANGTAQADRTAQPDDTVKPDHVRRRDRALRRRDRRAAKRTHAAQPDRAAEAERVQADRERAEQERAAQAEREQAELERAAQAERNAPPKPNANAPHKPNANAPPNRTRTRRQTERERAAQAERERAAQTERERAAQTERERAAQAEHAAQAQRERAAQAERERAERERAAQAGQERQRADRESAAEAAWAERERATQAERTRAARAERAAWAERARTERATEVTGAAPAGHAAAERAGQAQRTAQPDQAEPEHAAPPGDAPPPGSSAQPDHDAPTAGAPSADRRPAAAVAAPADQPWRPLSLGRPAGSRRSRTIVLAVAVVALLAVGPLALMLSHPGAPKPNAAEMTRDEAAAWVAQQVSSADVVSCDVTMCLALEAHGVSVSNLLVLGPTARDIMGSQVVMSTATIRDLFGTRLSSVYAPAVLASFGSGKIRIDVRVIAPEGAEAYLSAFRADLQQRKDLGAQLAAFPKIVASAAARRQLASGRVDARLMFVISFLATANRLDIVEFGDSAPGATAGVPLRSVTLAGSTAYLRSMLASVRSSQAPYLAAHAGITQFDGRPALFIEFAGPSPLGLINGPNP